MRTNLRRWLRRPAAMTALLAVVLLLVGATLWITSSAATKTAAVTSRLVAASLGTVRQSVTTTGTIEPAVQDSLNFAAPGKVTSVAVAADDKVMAGEVLATIDPTALQASLAQAQATLANDQAKVAADESSSATSTQLAADQAAVTVAQAQVASATSALAGASLRSPIAGVVASVSLQAGQQISASSGTGSSSTGTAAGSSTASGSAASSSASAAIVVIATNAWLVDTTVDDTQVGLIAKGNQAQITTTGSTSTVYGTVASVGIVASTSSGTASYPVVVNVTGNPSGLHAGASATVALIYRQLTNVLTVPSLAVHVSNGKSIVYEQSGTTQVARAVTTGLSSGAQVQILTGLTAGEQVIVSVPTAGSAPRGTGSTGGGRGGPGGGGFGGGGFGGGGFGGGGGGLGGG